MSPRPTPIARRARVVDSPSSSYSNRRRRVRARPFQGGPPAAARPRTARVVQQLDAARAPGRPIERATADPPTSAAGPVSSVFRLSRAQDGGSGVAACLSSVELRMLEKQELTKSSRHVGFHLPWSWQQRKLRLVSGHSDHGNSLALERLLAMCWHAG